MYNANDVITVYNTLLDDDGVDRYHRTVITGVSWFGSAKTTVTNDGGLVAADAYTVRIPTELCADYVNPKEYDGNGWTLKAGDFIIKGAGQDITLPRELTEAYSDFMTILSVTDNRDKKGGHIKVVGK